jgi:pilus assembly protein Flp/PilA
MLSLYLYIMSWLKRDEGQSMAEYGLILALIAIVVILALTALGTEVRDVFQQVADAIGVV